MRWLGESGCGEFGEFFFEIEKLVIKPVVVVVGNHRLGFDVISAVVQADFLDELGVA